MARRIPSVMRSLGTYRRSAVVITGAITIGAAGAVTSYACEACDNTGGIVKNAAAGRYDIVFLRKFRNFRLVGAPGILGPATAAFGNADGNTAQWRPATTNFHATLQTFLASSGADTNTTSGNVIHFAIEVQL